MSCLNNKDNPFIKALKQKKLEICLDNKIQECFIKFMTNPDTLNNFKEILKDKNCTKIKVDEKKTLKIKNDKRKKGNLKFMKIF